MFVLIKYLRKSYRYTYKAFFSKYDVIIEREVKGLNNLLDVGCGANSPVQTFNKNLYCVGVDAFEPSLEKSKVKKIHNDYKKLDVLKVGEEFPSKSFDIVVALDLIEHLEKGDGLHLLDMIEKIASKKVIIYTPNGFLPQGDRENNPWQVHLSGWTAQEFVDRGYKVIGVNGIKSLRGAFAKVKYKPAFLWNFISDLTELFVKHNPEIAFQLLAIKTIQT